MEQQRSIDRAVERALGRAWLHDDPAAFRAGVTTLLAELAAARAAADQRVPDEAARPARAS